MELILIFKIILINVHALINLRMIRGYSKKLVLYASQQMLYLELVTRIAVYRCHILTYGSSVLSPTSPTS